MHSKSLNSINFFEFCITFTIFSNYYNFQRFLAYQDIIVDNQISGLLSTSLLDYIFGIILIILA